MVLRERQLRTVQPAVTTASRGVAERPDHHRNLLRLHLVRHFPVNVLRDLGRRQQHVPALDVGLRPSSQVRELTHDQAVVPVDRVGDGAIGGNDRVVVVGDHVPRRGRRGRVDAGGAADDREGGAAPGLCLVVGAQSGAGLAILGHRLRVPAREDAVLEREATHAKRREQVPKLMGHGDLLAPLSVAPNRACRSLRIWYRDPAKRRERSRP